MNFFTRIFRNRKEDLAEELRAHLAMAERDQVEGGKSPEEARFAALREFGNVPLLTDRTRETWGVLWPERLLQDIRYSLRQMRRSPGFAATVIGTLALGIGAAAAMFTVVDRVLLRPVAYPDPAQLMVISEGDHKGATAWLTPWLDIEQWTKQSKSFEQIAFATEMKGRNYLETGNAAFQIQGELVSSNLFSTLGVQPSLGRSFFAEPPSFVAGKNTGTIILSDAVWRQAFAADPRILGRQVKINDATWVVIGVMPRGFRFPAGSAANGQVWGALRLAYEDRGRGLGSTAYRAIGRLWRGATVANAQAEMSLIQKQLAPLYPDHDIAASRSAISFESYSDSLVAGDVRKALLALFAASGVLWLIAGVNVTNLLLARSVARQREIAMRGALGASRWRILQQLMVEALVLSTVASVLGGALALSSVKLLAHELTQHLPLPAPAEPDAFVLFALMALTVLTALLAVAWPALLAIRAPLEPALKQGGAQTGMARKQHWLRASLVAAELAMSLVLLVACGLLLQTISKLRNVPLGYRTDHIVVADLNIPAFRFTGKDMARVLYGPMLERIQHLHGVESAGLISEVPLSQTSPIHLQMQMNGYAIRTVFKAVSFEMQQVLGFGMAAGRFFGPQDTATSRPVLVVNQAFARHYAPDKHNLSSILGGNLLDLKENVPMQIVGILDDAHQHSIADPAQPEIEIAIPQMTPDGNFYGPMEGSAMDVAIRTQRPAAEMIPELRDILRLASPEFKNVTITTMDQIVEDSYGSQRLAAHLLEIFGGAALLLCATGLYGLLAYVVTQRTRELGLRIALGASRAGLLWMVMRQAGEMLVAGLVVGAVLTFVSARLVRGFLYEVSPHDVSTLLLAGGLLMVTGLVAAYLPARRAAMVDPMEALRAE